MSLCDNVLMKSFKNLVFSLHSLKIGFNIFTLDIPPYCRYRVQNIFSFGHLNFLSLDFGRTKPKVKTNNLFVSLRILKTLYQCYIFYQFDMSSVHGIRAD